MKNNKKVEAEAFLGNKVEQLLADLRKGRTLEVGERFMKGGVGQEVNAPERIANYM